jgi:hypothetical protein
LEQCSPEQLAIIKKQLPPDECLENKRQQHRQRCSFTYASRCPDAVWLEDFYTDIHSKTSSSQLQSPFVSLFIGCNKGFDAFNALRMGSGNRHFEKANWRKAITKRVEDSGGRLHHNVCNQDAEPQFPLPESSPNSTHTDAIVHCIEPMPQTYKTLRMTASSLNMSKIISKSLTLPFHRRTGQFLSQLELELVKRIKALPIAGDQTTRVV